MGFRFSTADVFGNLVRISAPILKNFHGDLYHDAMHLERLNDLGAEIKDIVVIWGVGPSGTYILLRDKNYTDSNIREWVELWPGKTIYEVSFEDIYIENGIKLGMFRMKILHEPENAKEEDRGGHVQHVAEIVKSEWYEQNCKRKPNTSGGKAEDYAFEEWAFNL